MSLASANHRLRTRSPNRVIPGSCAPLPIPPRPVSDNAAADSALRNALTSLAATEPDYWSFKGRAARDAGHGLFQYPAMMVPQMLGALLDAIMKAYPDTKSVLDPFIGSGTVLTEAMLRGLDFHGQDINPLAVLVSRAKCGSLNTAALRPAIEQVLDSAAKDLNTGCEADFMNLDKWFRDAVAANLSRLRRAIRKQSDLHVRRFLWVALAETVRVSSNSRLSTVKLHIRTLKDRRSRRIDVMATFLRVAAANLNELETFAAGLQVKHLLTDGSYGGSVSVSIGDTAKSVAQKGHLYDVLLTSPPYGDNATTVTYGQHAYLPLQWIDLADIDPGMDSDYLRTTREIDRRSLGGSRRIDKETVEELTARSRTLQTTLASLPEEPKDRRARVISFVRDLDSTLDPILAALKPDALMVWIIGNRHVARQRIPTDQILAELLSGRGAVEVHRLDRRIASKRMAAKNATTATMTNETILVMRKARPHAI
jgi:hypothetical protein